MITSPERRPQNVSTAPTIAPEVHSRLDRLFGLLARALALALFVGGFALVALGALGRL